MSTGYMYMPKIAFQYTASGIHDHDGALFSEILNYLRIYCYYSTQILQLPVIAA